MGVDYRNRDQLYRSAVEALGREEADTLMASLAPMDWSEMATKADLASLEEGFDDRLDRFELRITSHVDRALRQQTQWVFGAVVLQAVAMIAALTLG